MMQEREHADPFLGGYSNSAPQAQFQSYSPYADLPAGAGPGAYAHPQAPYAAQHPSYGLGTESQLDSYRDDPAAGYPPASPNNSALLLPMAGAPPGAVAPRSYGAGYNGAGRAGGKKKRLIALGALAGVILVVAAVVIPVYFLVIKKHSDSNSSSGGGAGAANAGGGGNNVVGAVTGADGSSVVTENGESFVYNNSFGGYWAADPADPFGPSGRTNSWTPPLNETWDWGTDKIYGVNLGGWFVLEPFITPALFQAYPSAPDEWTLAALMRADGTLQATMEAHYEGFIVRFYLLSFTLHASFCPVFGCFLEGGLDERVAVLCRAPSIRPPSLRRAPLPARVFISPPSSLPPLVTSPDPLPTSSPRLLLIPLLPPPYFLCSSPPSFPLISSPSASRTQKLTLTPSPLLFISPR
ncbi:hypothetical protein FB451DRAFT_413937 [Mycena latifolia]|nr:hypothetical protein FB451DRAFT_413937 [Mycena latifolia]